MVGGRLLALLGAALGGALTFLLWSSAVKAEAQAGGGAPRGGAGPDDAPEVRARAPRDGQEEHEEAPEVRAAAPGLQSGSVGEEGAPGSLHEDQRLQRRSPRLEGEPHGLQTEPLIQGGGPQVQTEPLIQGGGPQVQTEALREEGGPQVQTEPLIQEGGPQVQTEALIQGGGPQVQTEPLIQGGGPQVQTEALIQEGGPQVQTEALIQGGGPQVQTEAPPESQSSEAQPVESDSDGTQVLVLGLDGAGKTSLLHCLSTGNPDKMVEPTEGFNAVSINRDGLHIEFLEIGGRDDLRPFWRRYLPKALLLVFVVDASSPQRFPVAKEHLQELLLACRPRLPLMVLANKQDVPSSLGVTDVHDALSLSEVGDRQLFLIGTSVRPGEPELCSGVQDARDLMIQIACCDR